MSDDEVKLVRVPVRELKTAMHGARTALDENRRLTAELEQFEEEAKELELKLLKRQHQLDCCSGSRVENRPYRPGDMLKSAPRRPRPKSEMFSASMHNLIEEQAETLNQLADREENLRALMDAMREISRASDAPDVVSNALRAAQHVLQAEKYTVGILNEKKDRVELYSNPPMELPGKRYLIEEGSALVDSATTFGRVVLTGTPLEVADVSGSEVIDVFEEQMQVLEFEPEALLCAPIFNVHGVLVGVFQVITRKILPEEGHATPSESQWYPSTPRTALSRLGRNQEAQQKGAFDARDKENFDYICVSAGTALWNLSLAKAHQAMQSRIECLLKLNRNIAAEVSASAVLHQIIAVAYELLHAEHIALYVRDEGTDDFYLFVTDSKDEMFLKAHNGIVGVVMRTGQLILTNAAPTHQAFDPKYDEFWASLKTKQVLCAPVKDASGQVLAVVSATNKVDGDEFTADDALYLNYAAEAAGISLHKSNLLRAVLMSQRLTEARLQLADFVSSNGERAYNNSSHEPEDETSAAASVARFVRVVMAEGRKLLHCDRFGFLLVDPLKKELWITQEDEERVRMPLTKGLSGLIATTGKTVNTRDAYTHPHFDPSLDRKTGYRTTSVLGMPVFEDHTPTNPKIVAVVIAINKKDDGATNATEDEASRRNSRHRVPFTTSDAECMTQYCREIQFALGRLSLDISYYKVVSDCGLSAPGEIVSSIVQKYCQSSELDALEEMATAAYADDPDEHTTPFAAIPFPPRNPQRRISTPRENGHVIGVGDVTRWDFSCLDLSNADIFAAVSVLFHSLGLLERFQVAQDTFSTFLSHVASHYRPNAYHNLQHAFQVTHATYCLLRRSGVAHSYFARVEIFAMLIAALCHDLDHPGNTNDFEVKTHSQLALTHNDDAVLERHHCRVAFIILSHPGANLFGQLPTRACFVYVRRLLIHCILATDMAKHFEKCKALESLSKRHLLVNNNGGKGAKRGRSKHRFVFMTILIHAADLSSQALPYTQAARWGMRVLSEYQQQAKSEAELHFPVESFMANLHHAETRVTVQLNFINYVLRPIWLPLATLCPAMKVYADSLESNRERYKAELDKLQREAAEVEELARVSVRGASSRKLVERVSSTRRLLDQN
ncbi:3'5'-cyclic nucleotide phosphodiesterase, putative [Phytophthora infestans T30-4]|uniref:Phosphodiesterase n=1 Tax=Phytophthora infestans (strain T30-4) TaxID=403677 RepID=D0MQY9_PHYIT|nr:3'5'-cyclic nucleotide phosphodiesterase, putative [Phytophthora infestans T30-4]EEY57908.1 3'5'-cyclic nucleotide phosphodiesterase, putative [Phytophthora infestans T30-4]|eukprot:XP_002909094.1 3'5'-cyclic nucleotide phosphodiesterase, putative [Phytophthora infestans T30-4]